MSERELHEWILDLQLQNDNLEKQKEDLEAEIDDLRYEIEHLKEEIEYIEQDREDNYKPIPISEQVGITDKDFI